MTESFFAELKRHSVIKVDAACLAGSWMAIEVGGTLLSTSSSYESLLHLVILLPGIGLIPVLNFSWVFEITPECIKKIK
ncbi:MAG: hypothetical protein GY808_15780 [Gammaproteobacteria bacterium]|nr:hypothetical protein [Gammaproteobacteria bacterium]